MSDIRIVIRVVCVILFAGLAGCGPNSATQTASGPSKDTSVASSDSVKKDGHAAHDHSAWWCNEHGVPEDECGRCNAKLAAQFQKKGDWCKEHDRPDSQCFICHPEKEAQYAAKYEAKFGEKPPKPEVD
jgi:cobalt-zinc-cadmium efflux system membrane fusion protein